MELGMIGLGRMGANMVERLMKAGHKCVVFDSHADTVQQSVAKGAKGTTSLPDFVKALSKPRAVWLMLPAAAVDSVLHSLVPLLERDDIVIEGGNSYYHDDIRRAKELKPKGLHYVDVGVSGGVWGLERGYCHMIGGEDAVVKHLDPIFRSLAPGVDTAPRTPGATGEPTQAEYGYLHCGPNGAGHFVKMVHNGIEYGMMQAFAEGFNIIKNANVGLKKGEVDAETTPLRDPDHFQVQHRRGAGRRNVAARQRGRVVAARPHRRRLAAGPGAGAFPGPGLGFRRRPLDAACRDRGRRAGAGDQRGALFPI